MKLPILALAATLALCHPAAAAEPEANQPKSVAEQRAIAEAKRKRDLLGVILAQHIGPVPASAPTHYVDADTFDLPLHPFGDWTTPTRIRLINANAPETRQPKCTREKELAKQATALTVSILSAPGARIELSVLDGFDEYNRYLAAVTVDGQDLGEMLVDAGLARVWTKEYEGQTKEYWCSATPPLNVTPSR